MFGTVARLRLRQGAEKDLVKLMEEVSARRVDGYLQSIAYRDRADPSTIWLAVAFRDEESYRRNADDPVTDTMARQMAELLLEPPEWNDGEIIASYSG